MSGANILSDGSDSLFEDLLDDDLVVGLGEDERVILVLFDLLCWTGEVFSVSSFDCDELLLARLDCLSLGEGDGAFGASNSAMLGGRVKPEPLVTDGKWKEFSAELLVTPAWLLVPCPRGGHGPLTSSGLRLSDCLGASATTCDITGEDEEAGIISDGATSWF